MKKGRIKNINSTKYVVDFENKDYNCTLRGIFRKTKVTPLVGDIVDFDENLLRIDNVYERKNYLPRPNIANVDIALIVTSTKKPDLDLVLLDKLLSLVTYNNIVPLICLTKMDLLNDEEFENINNIRKYYESIGIKVIDNTQILEFEKYVSGKVIVACGQTGAGKSSFINKIDPSLELKTSEISLSLNRGVHTTRYVSLYKIKDYYIADTPGFSALDLNDIPTEDIKYTFIEFLKYDCKYRDCNHINTEGCNVINNKNILKSRYDNYVKFVKESNENSGKFFKNR